MSKQEPAPVSIKRTTPETGERRPVSEAQVRLLAAIDESGSISAAARAVGISYRTAWDRLDRLNNLSPTPLVVRSAGGSSGGGTQLTDLGRRLLAGFQLIQQRQLQLIASLDDANADMGDMTPILQAEKIQTSARNQFLGTITSISHGGVNSEVELSLGENRHLVALVTNESIQRLGLVKGQKTLALIKASWVMLSTHIEISTSARNKISGTIKKIDTGEVNSEVVLELGGGKTLCAVVTNHSVSEMALKKDQRVCALFKASSVILVNPLP